MNDANLMTQRVDYDAPAASCVTPETVEPAAPAWRSLPELPDDLAAPPLVSPPPLGRLARPDHGDATMQAVYACAHALCESNRHDQAEKLFRQLCVYDFRNADYVLGLGAVLQWKEDHESALDLYGIAYAINDQQPCYLYHAARCHLVLGQLDRARKCLEVVQACAQADAQDRARAGALLESISASWS